LPFLIGSFNCVSTEGLTLPSSMAEIDAGLMPERRASSRCDATERSRSSFNC
jgi:hypothetical protein